MNVYVARATNGRAVHYFPTDSLRPICDRLKNTPDGIDVTDDEVSCKACSAAFRKGEYALHQEVAEETGDDVVEGLDAAEDLEDEDLEGAEDDEDEDEEDERSTSKALKFTAFAQAAGWNTRRYISTGKFGPGDMTFATATSPDGATSIRLVWQEGKYQYNETRIIRGKGEVLNALVRNASAARGFIRAMAVQADATRPILRLVAAG